MGEYAEAGCKDKSLSPIVAPYVAVIFLSFEASRWVQA